MVILLGWVLGLPLPSAGHAPPPGGAQDEETSFRLEVDVDLVVLNVTVVDESGTNVTSLTREDFTVYEDGVRQDISTFFPVEAPFKLVLLVDTSISTRNNLKLIKDAARNFTKELRPDDQISVTETHFFTQEVQKFTNNRKLLRRAIKRLSTYPYGGSRVYDGVAMALKSLQRTRSGRKAIVVLSDGMENSSRVKFRGIAQAVGHGRRGLLSHHHPEQGPAKGDPGTLYPRQPGEGGRPLRGKRPAEPLGAGRGLPDSNRAIDPALRGYRREDVSGGRPVGFDGRVFQGCP